MGIPDSSPNLSWDVVQRCLLLNSLIEQQVELDREKFRGLVGEALSPYGYEDGFIKKNMLVVEFQEEIVISLGSATTLEEWNLLLEKEAVISPEDFLFMRFDIHRKINDLRPDDAKPVYLTGHSLGGVHAYLAADREHVRNVIIFGELRSIVERSATEKSFPVEHVLSIQNRSDPIAQDLWGNPFPFTVLADSSSPAEGPDEPGDSLDCLKRFLEKPGLKGPLVAGTVLNAGPELKGHSVESYRHLIDQLAEKYPSPADWFEEKENSPVEAAAIPGRSPFPPEPPGAGKIGGKPAPPGPTIPPRPTNDTVLRPPNRLRFPLKIVVMHHPRDGNRATYFVDSLRLLFDGFSDSNDGYLAGASGLVGVLRVLTAVPCPQDKISQYFEDTCHTIVVVLGDDFLARDRTMMGWLEEACRQNGKLTSQEKKEVARHLILPIALHDRAFEPLDQSGEFCKLQRKVATNLGEDSVQSSYVALLVLHEAYRLLADQIPGERRLKVFLSHAKKDGLPLVQAINAQMDHLPGRLNESRFYDSEHLRTGRAWRDQLRSNAANSIMLALRTRAYETRAWCREEFRTAVTAGVPIIVVEARSEDALASSDSASADARRQSVLPFNNFPVTHIRDGNLIRVIGIAMTEGLKQLIFERDARQLERLGLLSQRPFKCFNLATRAEGLLRQCEELEAEEVDRNVACLVLHQEPELNVTLSDAYHRIVRRFFKRALLCTCNRVYDANGTDVMETSLEGRVVGVSIAEVEGLLPEVEMNKLILHVVDRLFNHGATIAFGHDWREGGVMEAVYDRMKHSEGYEEDSRTRIINMSPWSGHQSNARQKQIEAHLSSLEIKEPGLPEFLKSADSGKWGRALFAFGLSQLRADLTGLSNARICIGGKMKLATGAMAGILEEAALALDAEHPLYLCGHWGGATGAICELIRRASVAEAVGNPPANQPKIEESDFEPKTEVIAEMKALRDEPGIDIPEDFASLEKCFATVSKCTLTDLSERNGLTEDENRELFEVSDIRQAMCLILQGLKNLSIK